MTLCKYRPQKTFSANYVIEKDDVIGLMKVLGQVVHEMGEAGEYDAAYYVGALTAFEVMFGGSELKGEIDKWTDFMRALDARLDEKIGGE